MDTCDAFLLAGVGGVSGFFGAIEPGGVIVVPNFGATSLLGFAGVVGILVTVATAPTVGTVDVFAGIGDAAAIVCDVVRGRVAVLFT